jgi:hypothetical protein
VRLALGAPAGSIVRSVLLRGIVPTAIGLCLGAGVALLLRRTIAGLFVCESRWVNGSGRLESSRDRARVDDVW